MWNGLGMHAAVAEGTLRLETEIDPLAAEWDALADRAGGSPFVRPGWTAAWWRAFGRGEPVVATLRRGGELAAVLALERDGHLRTAANWHSPHVEVLAADDAARHELLLGLMRRERCAVELLLLGRGTFGAVAGAARAARWRVVSRTVAESPYVALEGDFAAYEAALPRKRRKETRRQWRRLEDEGGTLDISDGREGLDGLLAEGLAVEGSGWKSEQGTAIADDPRIKAFYEEIARWAADRGWLRLAFIRVGDEPVAFDFALVDAGVWYALKGGFDVRFRSHGPGTVLLWHTVRRAYEEGLSRMDLLGQSDPYKLDWAQGTTERLWLQAFPRTPRGSSAFAAAAARERVRPVVRRVRQRLAERRAGGDA